MKAPVRNGRRVGFGGGGMLRRSSALADVAKVDRSEELFRADRSASSASINVLVLGIDVTPLPRRHRARRAGRMSACDGASGLAGD